MTDERPSQSAFTAAAARAAHLVVDREPYVFEDALAARLLGDRAEELLDYHRKSDDHPILAASRAMVLCRARVAEDVAATAEQYVVLGAGFDTFAYRTTGPKVFEIDRPGMQKWKKKALADAGIAIPGNVTFAPDLAGLDPTERTVVSWLGVVMYLTREEIEQTLAALPPCELVFDHMLPAELRDADGDMYVAGVAPVAEAGGEPWRTFLSPSDAAALLDEHGYDVVEHVRQRDLPAMHDRSDALRPGNLSVITHARHRLL